MSSSAPQLQLRCAQLRAFIPQHSSCCSAHSWQSSVETSLRIMWFKEADMEVKAGRTIASPVLAAAQRGGQARWWCPVRARCQEMKTRSSRITPAGWSCTPDCLFWFLFVFNISLHQSLPVLMSVLPGPHRLERWRHDVNPLLAVKH